MLFSQLLYCRVMHMVDNHQVVKFPDARLGDSATKVSPQEKSCFRLSQAGRSNQEECPNQACGGLRLELASSQSCSMSVRTFHIQVGGRNVGEMRCRGISLTGDAVLFCTCLFRCLTYRRTEVARFARNGRFYHQIMHINAASVSSHTLNFS